MEVWGGSTSVICRFQEGLWPSEERSVVWYSHWIWYTCEINWAN
jgi:hypothetical protein